LVINKCVTDVKVSNFSGHYLRNRSTLDIGVLGYVGIVQDKEHSPEILSIPPGTLCMLCHWRNKFTIPSGNTEYAIAASFYDQYNTKTYTTKDKRLEKKNTACQAEQQIFWPNDQRGFISRR